jgi:hypothetical protein
MAPWCGSEPGAVILGELEVRNALPAEMARVRELLDDEHYLGAARQVGSSLVQIVHHRERWSAILLLGPAAVKLLDRDEWIGWTHTQRAERLGLIVQNRRFLVLAETSMPNLASCAMGLALRNLPAHWEQKHGYRPLLAETFTDIESFEGTSYKASNWKPCSLTKGFERSHRSDFYREHRRPKKLWLKTLSRNTRVILRAMDLPAAYQSGCNTQSAERALPLKKASIQRYGQFLTQQQRLWLNFPLNSEIAPGAVRPATKRSPSYSANWIPIHWQTPSRGLARRASRHLATRPRHAPSPSPSPSPSPLMGNTCATCS